MCSRLAWERGQEWGREPERSRERWRDHARNLRGREISCESPDSPSGAASVWHPAGRPAAAIALAIPCFGSFFLKTRSDEICKHRRGTEGFGHLRGRPELGPRPGAASMMLASQSFVFLNAFARNLQESWWHGRIWPPPGAVTISVPERTVPR